MNSEIEIINAQAEKLRWMITQLDNSCDGTPVMMSFIQSKKLQLKDTMDQINIMKSKPL